MRLGWKIAIVLAALLNTIAVAVVTMVYNDQKEQSRDIVELKTEVAEIKGFLQMRAEKSPAAVAATTKPADPTP